MLIDKDLAKYTLLETSAIKDAIQKLANNKKRILFTLNSFGRVSGSFSDGDLRRWLLETETVDLETPVKSISNKKFISCQSDMDKSQIAAKFSDGVRYIPIVDENNHLVGVASLQSETISIAGHSITDESPSFIIAEIGNNHNGSLELAKKLVNEAALAGVDCAKFQMRDIKSLYRNQGNSNDEREDLGSQYVLDLLERFQLKDEEFYEIFDYCKSKGLAVLCTPFDKVSADKLAGYGVDAYKVASADLTNHDLLEHLAKKSKPLLISTGMATEEEIESSVKLLNDLGVQFILLQCNSTYPAPYKDVNLKYMNRLKDIGKCFVGYSGHERGYHVPVAAVAMGAKIVEKHFTLDKSMEGNDHKVSLLPDELQKMVKEIRDIEAALGNANPRTITQGELMNRETLAKSVIANVDIKKGSVIKADMLEIRSPGKGLAPYRMKELIGEEASRDIKAGDFFYPSDLDSRRIEPKEYQAFKQPFGIPVRYHDFFELKDLSNLQVIEFHLSYKDVDADLSKFFKKGDSYPHQLVVHAPELFAGDHTLDLCSLDEDYRQRSIAEMQRVIGVTNRLKEFFPNTQRPCIIVNCGGFSGDGFKTKEERVKLYHQLKDSLTKLDTAGVELIPQTMPPFPWHFGGQQYHNLFVDADETIEFCKQNELRICFDVSHTQLACNYYEWDFNEVASKLAPITAHYHLADASSEDSEGLQIGEGIIDFSEVFKSMNEYSSLATWIPEIWQGHKNSGEGFWLALERLDEISNKVFG